MPHGLRRFQQSSQSHFVTFTCFHRRSSFNSPELCDLFLEALESTRRRFALRVYGFVVVPEHVHLLLSEPGSESLAIELIFAMNFLCKVVIGYPAPSH